MCHTVDHEHMLRILPRSFQSDSHVEVLCSRPGDLCHCGCEISVFRVQTIDSHSQHSVSKVLQCSHIAAIKTQ